MTDKAMDQLTDKFQDLTMSFLVPQQDLHAQARAQYVQSKTNPTEKKDIQALEAKLALTYTEAQHNENTDSSREFITKETKLADYVKELEREFDERKALETNENEILEAFANKHFKPVTLAKGFWESEESRIAREKEANILARQKFILENKDRVLGAVLRKEINADLKREHEADKIPLLQNEDKAQQLLSPFYAQRIQELKNELISLDSVRKTARYYAKQPKPDAKNITNDEPTLPNAITAHYRLSLLKNELSKPMVSEKMSAEEKQKRQELIEKNTARSNEASEKNSHITKGRVQDGHAKAFKRLV